MAENYHEKTVYVANADTGKVDRWTCIGEFTTRRAGGAKENYCQLERGKQSCILPKRCVFETEEAARAVLNKHD